MPSPSATFAGISADDAAGVGGRFAPPDTVGDVGPNHYVQAVNTVLRVFDKNGAALTPVVSLGDILRPARAPAATASTATRSSSTIRSPTAG